MLLLQKCSTPLGLGRTQRLQAPRSLVAVRYRENEKTETTRSWQDSPYYSGANDDPSESLRNGFNNLKAKWDDWEPEKRNQTLAWGGGGLLVLYLANGLINQIDRLPLLPQFLQLVGFAFTSWFTYRYLLFSDGREDLSKLSLDKVLGRAEDEAEEFSRSFGRAFAEGGEGIGEAGDRIRKSEAGRAIKDATNDGKLSDGSSGGYSSREVKSNIKSARRDLEDTLP